MMRIARMDSANIVAFIPDPVVSEKRNVFPLVGVEESSKTCSGIHRFRHYSESAVRFIGGGGNQKRIRWTKNGGSWNPDVQLAIFTAAAYRVWSSGRERLRTVELAQSAVLS